MRTKILCTLLVMCSVLGLIFGCSAKLQGVSISNKDELQAAWDVGGADRIVSATLLPKNFKSDDITIKVSSSDIKVISTEGMTLKAVGAGTAVITVTADRFEDSVSITVSPVLTGVTISNKSDLSRPWVLEEGAERKISYALSPEEFSSQNTEVNIVSGNPSVISVSGNKLTPISVGKASITVSAGNFSDSVEMEVINLTTPTLSIDIQDTALKAVEGRLVKLPKVNALSCDEVNITQDIELTLSHPDKMVVTTGGLKVDTTGEYFLTYKVSDPRDENLFVEEVLPVTVYRNVFSYYNTPFLIADELAANEEQSATTFNSGLSYAHFNVAPSKVYYAEVTYNIHNLEPYPLLGMGHFVENNQVRALATVVDRGDRNFKIKDFEFDRGAEFFHEWESGTPTVFSYQLSNQRGIADDNANVLKYAVARINDNFYTFINDQYITTVNFEYYRTKDTIPGIFGYSMHTANVTAMDYILGQEAEAKVDEVLQGGSAIISPYVPFDWAMNSKDKSTFTVNPVTEQRGINFDYTDKTKDFNDSMVSPYIYLDGDFTFEWEYKNTDALNYEAESRMLAEVRPWNYGGEIVQFGADYISSNRRFLLNVPSKEDWNEPVSGFDNSMGARFTITRVLKDDYAEYTLTAVSIANPDQVGTRVIEWGKGSSDNESRWAEPVIILWHNTRVAGEYSNINWFAHS